MEPLRGFAEFMRAAAFAQQQLDNLHVVVAGDDRIAYSYSSNMYLEVGSSSYWRSREILGFIASAFSWACELWGAEAAVSAFRLALLFYEALCD